MSRTGQIIHLGFLTAAACATAAAVLPLQVHAETISVAWDPSNNVDGVSCCRTQVGVRTGPGVTGGTFDFNQVPEVGMGVNQTLVTVPTGIGGEYLHVVTRASNAAGQLSANSNEVVQSLPPRSCSAWVGNGQLQWMAFNGYSESIVSGSDSLPSGHLPFDCKADPKTRSIWVITANQMGLSFAAKNYATDTGMMLSANTYGPFSGVTLAGFKIDRENRHQHVFIRYPDGRLSNWILGGHSSSVRSVCPDVGRPNSDCYIQYGPNVKPSNSGAPWNTYYGTVTWANAVTAYPAAADGQYIVWTWPATATDSYGKKQSVSAMEIWKIDPENGKVLDKFVPKNSMGQNVVNPTQIVDMAYVPKTVTANSGMDFANPSDIAGYLTIMFAPVSSEAQANILLVNPVTHQVDLYPHTNTPYLSVYPPGTVAGPYRPAGIDYTNGAGAIIQFAGIYGAQSYRMTCHMDMGNTLPLSRVVMQGFPDSGTSYCTQQYLGAAAQIVGKAVEKDGDGKKNTRICAVIPEVRSWKLWSNGRDNGHAALLPAG